MHEFHNDLSFLQERMKIEKVENFVANLHDKTPYVFLIIFNQKAWLKPHSDMNTRLRQKTKINFEKDFLK